MQAGCRRFDPGTIHHYGGRGWARSGGIGLETVGRSVDGRPVVGFFELVDTHGVPLDIVLSEFDRRGRIPDWTGFYTSAVEKGWKPGGVISKLEAGIGDVFGPEYLKVWKEKMNKWLEENADEIVRV